MQAQSPFDCLEAMGPTAIDGRQCGRYGVRFSAIIQVNENRLTNGVCAINLIASFHGYHF